MRALATNAALRALRAASAYRFPRPADSLRFRSFCVNTPPVLSGTKTEPETQPIDSVDPLRSTSVSINSDEPSTGTEDSVQDVVTEIPLAANNELSREHVTEPSSKLEEGESDVAVENEEFVSSSASFDGNAHNRVDLNQFSTADELFTYLESTVNQAQMRAMLTFRTALEQDGTPLISEKSINLMLPVMARYGWFQTTKDTLRLAEEKGIALATIMYNCALFAMTRTGDLEAMQSVVQKMTEQGKNSRPNATSYNLLIASHFYQGDVEDAFAVLQDMKASAIYPTIATYQTLVSGCLRRRDYNRAYKTLLAIEQQGMSASAMTVAQVLYHAAQNDQYTHIPILMAKLQRIMPSYSRDVDRIAAKRSSYSKSNQGTLNESVRGTPRLELSCLTAVLHSAARGGRSDIAIQAWNMIEEMYPELEMTSDHWYSLIGALSGAGELEEAFDAIGHMNAAGIQPSIRGLSNILIRPLSMDVERIDDVYYHLVERIEGKDVIPSAADENEQHDISNIPEEVTVIGEDAELESNLNNAETTNENETVDEPAVEAQLEADTAADLVAGTDGTSELGTTEHVSLSEAIGIGSDSSNSGTQALPWRSKRRAEVTITELNCVIGACAMAGDLDRAFQTYDEACGRLGFTRNADTLNGLLEGCVQTRHIRGGMRILEEARADGTDMNMDTLHMACRLYCRVSRGGDALALLREAVGTDMPVAARTWTMLARHLARSGSFDESAECVELAVKQGFRENGIKPSASRMREKEENRSSADEDLEDVAIGQEDKETEPQLDSEYSTVIKADS